MRKTLACAFAFAGLAAPAYAAGLDLGNIKDPLPDTLTWNGVTLYGNIDVGYAYQTHGVPVGASFPQVLEYNIWNAKNAGKEISTITADVLQRTNIGLTIEEGIGSGWAAVGRILERFFRCKAD